MSFLKLAVPLAVLLLVPMAHAQTPPASDVTLSLFDLHGLVTEDSKQVVPYNGNVTVDFGIKLGCVAFFQAEANKHAAGDTSQLDHIDLGITNPPSWIISDSMDVPMDDTKCASTDVANNGGYVTLTGTYPFKVAANAPGIVPQTVNLTASLEAGASSPPMPLLFSVQFHPDYTVTPSIQFPYTVTGKTANFTVTITNNANTRSMVMVEQVHASTGAFSGIGSLAYAPPQTMVFPVTFKAPDACWSTAKVDFHTATHFLLLSQQAGSYKQEHDYSWAFTNGIACTPGKGNTTSKASPVGGLAVLPVVLGAALLARRRLL